MTPDERVESALGHRFRDRQLLDLALTHRSAGRQGRADRQHNERLEFLGDAVLGQLVAERLYRLRPLESEDALSIVRASLVRKETLAEIASILGLGDAIRLGSGERQSGGHKRPSILANALEALIGAVYLDGGHEAAGTLIDRLYGDRLVTASADAAKDAKTRLQEYLQAQNQALPVYAVEAVSGLAHARVFSVSCRIPAWDLCIAAQGTSRRAAEVAAAGRALDEVHKRGF
ncbi:MAG: ribonuclease III [Gammaproteobacteria bacterium]